jgi:DNA polymerase elongation subunit (family B)
VKILLLDIETSPNTAHVWGLWNQNIGLSQLRESSRVLCWAAKWYDETEIHFSSEHTTRHKTMIKRIHSLLSKADAVCHYNGTKFDIPTLQKEFLKYGLPPPAPFKQIDLLRTARSQFRFPSNKLDYVAQQLGLGKKVKHEGHELWLKCMAGDDEAWVTMERYNRNDVVLLEQVYNVLRPWIKNHPNMSTFTGRPVCPTCGSTHSQRRGTRVNLLGTYERYQCLDCGRWHTGTRMIKKMALDDRRIAL